MRWRHTEDLDVRIRVKFAWLPERGRDGTTYWLEWVAIKEQAIAHPMHSFWNLLSVTLVQKPAPHERGIVYWERGTHLL